MDEVHNFLAIYYHCTALAEAHVLSQADRYACNETYQQVKRLFIGVDLTQALTIEQNAKAYDLFKSWEAAHPEIVQALKTRYR